MTTHKWRLNRRLDMIAEFFKKSKWFFGIFWFTNIFFHNFSFYKEEARRKMSKARENCRIAELKEAASSYHEQKNKKNKRH